MRIAFATSLTLMTLILLGCVLRTEHTIDAHIRVDVRHVRQQADAVLDYIEGRTDTLPMEESGEGAGASRLHRILQALNPVQVAHASEDLRESSAEVTRLAESMRERHSDIEELKEAGCVGEDNRGYLSYLGCDDLEPEEEEEVRELVNEENEDRRALYQEITQLNAEDGVTLQQVQRIFAERRLQRAESGRHVQLPPAGPELEKFRNTAAGRRLDDEAQPNAWVELP
ncbi:MAG: DUF1318 domain-containing protein [Candidatus Hydrogenedentota bacterium]